MPNLDVADCDKHISIFWNHYMQADNDTDRVMFETGFNRWLEIRYTLMRKEDSIDESTVLANQST